MTIADLQTLVNEMTDEVVEQATLKGYFNSVISRINVTLGSTLPEFTSSNTQYIALNDNWLRLLFVTYASYAVKANDGSLNEADRFRSEFESSFRLLEENRFNAIPTAYQGDNFGNIYYMKADQGVNVGWFTTRNKGEDGF